MEHWKSCVDAWWLKQADEPQVAKQPTWCVDEAKKFHCRGYLECVSLLPVQFWLIQAIIGGFLLLNLISLFSPLPFGMVKRKFGCKINCSFFILPGNSVFIFSFLIKSDLVKTNLCLHLHPYPKNNFPQIYQQRTFRANGLQSIKAQYVENEYFIDKAVLLSFTFEDGQSPYHQFTVASLTAGELTCWSYPGRTEMCLQWLGLCSASFIALKNKRGRRVD